MKIAIIMWYNDKVKGYADINYSINKKYCDMYGYDIIKSKTRRTNFKAHWERIPLLITHMFNYDYVVWIDADAFFLKNSPPITNIIDLYPDKLFIFSSDINSLSDNDINSGVMIVKGSPHSDKILKEMYRNPKITCYGDNRYNGYIEDQGALRYMYKQNLWGLKEISVVIPYGVLQLFPDIDDKSILIPYTENKNTPYIYHLAGKADKERVIFSQLYIMDIFPTICKCGCVKYIDVPACCILCHKNKGHGPLCFTHGDKDNMNWLKLHKKNTSL